MARALFAATGLLLIAIAFIAATRVADTREGLIAEVVTLLAGLAGVALFLYGLIPRRQGARREPPRPAAIVPATRRSANDLLLGGGGIALSLALLGGLAVSGGWEWAVLGGVLLIPMMAGSVYLVIAFARAPDHDWSLDLYRLFRSRTGD